MPRASPKLNNPNSGLLTHCSIETPKRVISKLYRPKSDVWLGPPLFANSSTIFTSEHLDHMPYVLKIQLESSNIYI